MLDINSFLAEMDNEMDAMQTTILQLTRERALLTKAKEASTGKSEKELAETTTEEPMHE